MRYIHRRENWRERRKGVDGGRKKRSDRRERRHGERGKRREEGRDVALHCSIHSTPIGYSK